MRRFVGFLLTAVFAALVTCTPIDSAPFSMVTTVTEEGHHLTTGIGTRDNGGHPHIRREIRDLYANYSDQWALYLLGLLRFQQVDQNDPLSYYRISGIHAQPYELWQDAHGVPGMGVGAYCPHMSRLFITWHRPYLALFEQELWKHVKSIAEQAQVDRERWTAAADSFRIPYWDTARGVADGGIPEFLLSPRWPVVGPNGTLVIDNPLYWYQLHPLDRKDFSNADIARYNYTLRWPTTHSSDAIPQLGEWQKAYSEGSKSRQNDINYAFHWASSFQNFSESLENAHSAIHLITGGYPKDSSGQEIHGHMYNTETSAFDPTFMLHHANFDRLLALYTTANPNAWLEPSAVGGNRNWPTFWIPSGGTTDADTRLPPFWKNENEFWTSNDAHHTDVFGYAYPETQYWNFGSDEGWRNNVRGLIQSLYPNSARETLANAVATGDTLTHVVDVDSSFRDWVIHVNASATEMPSTYRAIFSLVGDFSSDASTEIGMWIRMRVDGSGSDAMEIRQAERKGKRFSATEQSLTRAIGLTSSLLDQITAGKLESLDPQAVLPYLEAHLTWNVYGGDDSKRLTPAQLESFAVEVTSTKVYIPKDPSQPLEYSTDTTSYPIRKV
ncbi:hypothetical protein PMIN04_009882 [Paraphaeosphaeria minitans]